MNDKDLVSIERILSILNELNILTKGKDAEYFYEKEEMIVLIKLIEELDENIDKIDCSLKEKYDEVDWDMVKKDKYIDDVFGTSMKLGDVWEIANKAHEVLYNSVFNILNSELESYYHKECLKHKKVFNNE